MKRIVILAAWLLAGCGRADFEPALPPDADTAIHSCQALHYNATFRHYQDSDDVWHTEVFCSKELL